MKWVALLSILGLSVQSLAMVEIKEFCYKKGAELKSFHYAQSMNSVSISSKNSDSVEMAIEDGFPVTEKSNSNTFQEIEKVSGVKIKSAYAMKGEIKGIKTLIISAYEVAKNPKTGYGHELILMQTDSGSLQVLGSSRLCRPTTKPFDLGS